MLKQKNYIKAARVKVLAEKIYDENGRGMTFEDITIQFELKKPKAQRTLKHFHTKKVLFTAHDLEKDGFHIKGIKRERPQRYFSIGSKTKVIERLRNNVLKDTTGYIDPQGHQKAKTFLRPSRCSGPVCCSFINSRFGPLSTWKKSILLKLSNPTLYRGPSLKGLVFTMSSIKSIGTVR